MSLKIKIALKDTATASIRNLINRAEDRAEMHETIALDLKLEWERHLTSKYRPRDKDGVEFWRHVIDSMESVSSEKGGEVSVDQVGARLRYYGGDVKPGKSKSSHTNKPTRALAIPTNKVRATGGFRVPPVQMGLLAFIPAAKGRETVGYLVGGVEVVNKRGKNKGKKRIAPKPEGNLLYTLRTITRHKADSGVIPDDARLTAIATASALRFIEGLSD